MVVFTEVLPEVFTDIAADITSKTKLIQTKLIAELIQTKLL